MEEYQSKLAAAQALQEQQQQQPPEAAPAPTAPQDADGGPTIVVTADGDSGADSAADASTEAGHHIELPAAPQKIMVCRSFGASCFLILFRLENRGSTQTVS